jgi:probable phosphomutase (TIGR03848 family)
MATLILARHGRTSANATGVLAGRSDGIHLDDTGTHQAREAADRVAGLPLAAIVTSPLERCRETAEEIRARQADPVAPATEARLLECDYGSWTGRALKELAEEPLWTTVQQQPSAVVFPEGESLPAMAARAAAACREWDARVEAEHGPGAVWLAVTHGDIIKSVVADALGLHLDLFQRIGVDPASLTVVRYTPLRPMVLTVNSLAGDLSGLRAPAAGPEEGGGPPPTGEAAVGGGAGALRPASAPSRPGTTP